MNKTEMNITFERYLPIEQDPYYVFTTNERYLVRCNDYPSMIGRLAPYQDIKLIASVEKKTEHGIMLNNVEWLAI